MRWIEFQIKTNSMAADAIVERLDFMEASGSSVKDPGEIRRILQDNESLAFADEDFYSQLGDDVWVAAYFADPDREDALAGRLLGELETALADIGLYLDVSPGEISYKYTEDEDWAEGWKKHFKSFRISERALVCPSWEECSPEKKDDVIIELDPQSAFGSGEHETTSMCAKFLDAALENRPQAHVLDLGCGSGILSILAAKLGSGRVLAVDLDPLALRVADENFENNGLSEFVESRVGKIEDLSGEKFDIIVANIIADVIVDIAPYVKPMLKEGGLFIAGGIIEDKEEGVLKAYSDTGFSLNKRRSENDWLAFEFTLFE